MSLLNTVLNMWCVIFKQYFLKFWDKVFIVYIEGWFWQFTDWQWLVTIWVCSQFEFLSFSQFEFFIFFSFSITIWVFKFRHHVSFWVSSQFEFLSFIRMWVFEFYHKGHPPSADLRYWEEDSISHSTLIFAAIKG